MALAQRNLTIRSEPEVNYPEWNQISKLSRDIQCQKRSSLYWIKENVLSNFFQHGGYDVVCPPGINLTIIFQ